MEGVSPMKKLRVIPYANTISLCTYLSYLIVLLIVNCRWNDTRLNHHCFREHTLKFTVQPKDDIIKRHTSMYIWTIQSRDLFSLDSSHKTLQYKTTTFHNNNVHHFHYILQVQCCCPIKLLISHHLFYAFKNKKKCRQLSLFVDCMYTYCTM